MKKILAVIPVLLLGIMGATQIEVSPADSFALVELFTSEGCSSCPAADEVLKEMTEILRKENKNVISLAYHITYWNKQGWEDPFSKEIFTERQKKYVKAMKVSQIFTPQAIVNGNLEFIGSNPFGFRNSVETVIANPPDYSLRAESYFEGDKLILVYDVNKVPRNSNLNVALVEPFIEHKVLRGENKNRLLHHYNVVRDLQTYEIKKKDSILLKYDTAFKSKELVLFLQHDRNMNVLAATRVQIKNHK